MNEGYTHAPHRRTEPFGTSPNAALLIDFDNVTMAIRSNLGQELRNFLNSEVVRGKVSVQRAYADWRRYQQYIVPLSEASIDLIFAPAYGSSKKNATDIRLAIDALELVFTRPEIGTYILLSGDSDFSSLVLKLKEYGKYVIGVGLQESSSDLLVQNCDEYYSYNSLSGLTSAEQVQAQSHDPWELLEKAVARMVERNDVMRSDRLKQVMLEFDSGFDEKDHGFSKFNRFLAEASSRGLLRIRKVGDGQYEVAPVEGKDASVAGGREEAAGREEMVAAPSRGGEASRRQRSRGGSRRGGSGSGGRTRGADSAPSGSPGPGTPAPERPAPEMPASEMPAPVETETLRAAYRLLREVVHELAPAGGGVRDSEVKREMLRRDRSFDEASLGFSKFSRFLRQAYDEEVVELEVDDDGNYHLGPSGGTREPAASAPTPRDAAPEPSAATGPAPASEPGPATPTSREAAPTGPTGSAEPQEAEADVPQQEEGDVAEEADQDRSRPSGRSGVGASRRGSRSGLGRFRPGTRGAGRPSTGVGSGDGGGEPPSEKTAPAAEASEDREEEAATGAAAATSSLKRAASSRRSTGLGRFRRGRQGADGPGAGSTAVSDGPSGESGDGGDGARAEAGEAGREAPETGTKVADSARRASGPGETIATTESRRGSRDVPEEALRDPVQHMARSYAGVGRRTAEKLVEAFGDELFEVIDRQPGRLSEVLPEHRAQAVVEAREAEREAVGT